MKILYNKIFLEHDTGWHPENRKRLEIFRTLPETEIPSGESYLELVHKRSYIDSIRLACGPVPRYLEESTIISSRTFEVACYAVGAAIMASEQGDFALVRPPGHHAYPDKASGFCFFNNIAIASQKLIDQGKRVLILDFDGHFGDGTSHIFYNNDEVLYWSLHQFPAFPDKGFIDEYGKKKGKGYTINVPLPPGSGDDIFMHAFHSFLPIAEQFHPDVVAVSAGFDAHQYDLLLELRLTLSTYYKIGSLLRQRFDNIFAVLEGGYSVDELYKGVNNFINGINGGSLLFPEKETTSSRRVWEAYEMNVHSVMNNLAKFWSFNG